MAGRDGGMQLEDKGTSGHFDPTGLREEAHGYSGRSRGSPQASGPPSPDSQRMPLPPSILPQLPATNQPACQPPAPHTGSSSPSLGSVHPLPAGSHLCCLPFVTVEVNRRKGFLGTFCFYSGLGHDTTAWQTADGLIII